MFHPLTPGHFRYVYEALNSGLELDEGAVIGQVDNLTDDARARRIDLANKRPWIRRELLESKRHTLLLAVVFEDLDVDLVANVEQFRRMIHAAPGKIRYVE